MARSEMPVVSLPAPTTVPASVRTSSRLNGLPSGCLASINLDNISRRSAGRSILARTASAVNFGQKSRNAHNTLRLSFWPSCSSLLADEKKPAKGLMKIGKNQGIIPTANRLYNQPLKFAICPPTSCPEAKYPKDLPKASSPTTSNAYACIQNAILTSVFRFANSPSLEHISSIAPSTYGSISSNAVKEYALATRRRSAACAASSVCVNKLGWP